jgi:phospholipid N-methyltransferase
VTAVCAYSGFFQFFRSWVADPRRVAAVAPSGDALSRLITQHIAPSYTPVLELGAGTGPILDRLGLKATRIGGTVRNIPPAAVYRIIRRQPVGIARRASIPGAPTA